MLYLLLQLVIQDTAPEQPNGERLRQGTGDGACALSERASFPAPGLVPRPRSSPDPVVRGVLEVP